MEKRIKNLSNPFSTGGGGVHFEAHIQASFVVLMLTGGYAPSLPCWPIKEIKLQGKIDGFDTDDLIVFVEDYDKKKCRKLLGQVKHSIAITEGSSEFSEVIQAAWNDFNNSNIFNKSKDIIALITGPLSKTDTHNVQWILNQARHTKDVNEFFRHVDQTKFSPAKSREKLSVIQYHLKAANNNIDISNDELYSFLKHFHLLGYDLGKEVGVVLSLLHSHISQFNRQNPQWLWSKIVDTVQTWNQDAGTITKENLPEDIIEAFEKPVSVSIPKEFTNTHDKLAKTDWNQHQYATNLALANLIGSWNEKNEADIAILSSLIGMEYSSWVLQAQEILHLPNSPFSLKNGQWKITNRAELWDSLGSRIFDQNLDTFKSAVISVLTEPDPCFDLPQKDRFAASIYGKIMTHSSSLRKGLADGLAILGSKSEALANCSQRKAEYTAISTIREIFSNADWMLWGSLNDLLPTLAEAAPDVFLTTVENALQIETCPFDELFSQEGNGITGGSYIIGLLWALEALAWDEKYLVRVCVILGELASRDPGGQFTNRPANSLTTILLPWLPQTIAPIEKRKTAVKTLCKEWPEIAWKLLISLLPNQMQTSSGSYKPKWRNIIPDDWEKSIPMKDYWEQVNFYSEMTVKMAANDLEKLHELIDYSNNLPKSSFDNLIDILSANSISELPEEKRLSLWDTLTKFIVKNKRFSDAKWALDDTFLSKMEVIADKIAPSNPFNLYQHLFCTHDTKLYEKRGNWEEQSEKLVKHRKKAIEEILKIDGIKSALKFVESVESPEKVGYYLAEIATLTIDKELLPSRLNTDNHKLALFICEYIFIRYNTKGWLWADELDKKDWDKEQISQFLTCLPFTQETWNRVESWLGDKQGIYWLQTSANPYQTTADDTLSYAIDKLIEHKRPNAALDCLYYMHDKGQTVNIGQCINALLSAATLSEPPDSLKIDAYQIVELIKMLQDNHEVNAEKFFHVEWTYLPLLNGYSVGGASPKFLENRLATEPEFFCELIQFLYRSKKADVPTKELSEKEKNFSEYVFQLLDNWKTPPGVQTDGSFNDSHFSNWLKHVKEICTESGHLEVALIKTGEVLIHCPPDNNGLWINKSVAEALNARDAEEMRNGFRTGIYNSQGTYTYSLENAGKRELKLAEQYHKKADEVENAGYHRFAVTLRSLSQTYKNDAKYLTDRHSTNE